MILTDESKLLIPCDEVSIEDGTDIIKLLEEELRNSEVAGVGLAACQIGVSKKVFIIRTGKHGGQHNFINPQITSYTEPLIFRGEGCLSYPGKCIRTFRYNKIRIVDVIHPNGIDLHGLTAVVAQHEYQHTIGHSMFRNQLSNLTDNTLCVCGSNALFGICCKRILMTNMRIL